MGRYRPPQKPESKYITPEGKQKLDEELDFLWRKKRPEVTAALSAAAAEGDRSENAEYIYRKKQLGEIDRRVRFLRKRLENIAVVEGEPDDPRTIFFGAWVRLENETGDERSYRVVGPDEFDMDERYISMDSPMARAMMKRRIDDSFTVKLPSGEAEFYIVDVSYKPFQQ